MKNAAINISDNLASMIGTTVGYIKVNESWVHHNNSYECAAWWEDSTITKGVYSLTLEKSSYAPYNLYLLAKIDAIVTDDFFPALWAGVAISNKPYQSRNLGQHRTVRHSIDLVEGIVQTGNSPGNKIDVCVNPLIIQEIINAARQTLNKYEDSLNQYWSEYRMSTTRTSLSMVAYCTENMAALCRAIEKMEQVYTYFDEASDYMRNNYVNNTSWATASI